MARRRGFSSIPTRSARSTAWAVGPAEADGALSATGAEGWSSGVVTTLSKVTIVRIRGFVHSFLNSGDAIGSGFFGAWGIGLATSAAFSAGIASLPTPLTEEDWDGWIWHSYFDCRTVTATIADGVNGSAVSYLKEIDSKAMRKFDNDMTLFGATEVVESANAGLETQAQCRMLVKLG